jgi:DNA-binding NarL/FixJ family response regulator
MDKPRVIIADDHELVASGLERLLAAECDVVATAQDGETLEAHVRGLAPDVVVLDMSMPPHGGLAVIRELREHKPSPKIVVVTMNDDPDVAAEAFRLGAVAYVLKNCAAAELLEAVRQVMRGQTYVTPLVAGGMLDALLSPGRHKAGAQLTEREREVLRLLADGKSMKDVAAILRMTVRTVAFHKYSVMKRLNIKTSAELVRFAVTERIV